MKNYFKSITAHLTFLGVLSSQALIPIGHAADVQNAWSGALKQYQRARAEYVTKGPDAFATGMKIKLEDKERALYLKQLQGLPSFPEVTTVAQSSDSIHVFYAPHKSWVLKVVNGPKGEFLLEGRPLKFKADDSFESRFSQVQAVVKSLSPDVSLKSWLESLEKEAFSQVFAWILPSAHAQQMSNGKVLGIGAAILAVLGLTGWYFYQKGQDDAKEDALEEMKIRTEERESAWKAQKHSSRSYIPSGNLQAN